MTILRVIYNGRKEPSDQHPDLTFLSVWFQEPVHHKISIGSQLLIITDIEHKYIKATN